MKSYESTATIAAGPDDVWAALVDAASWPSWNSGVDAVEGTLAEGQKITIRSSAAPGRAFPVKVTAFEPFRRLAFSGGMPLGLFRGERTYTLTPAGAGTVFRMREEDSGPMLPLIWKPMPGLQPSVDRFAAGLQQRVESGA